MFVLIAAGFAVVIGAYSARTQDVFPLNEGAQPCAVIRVRQEGLLCIGLDLAKHTATGTFEFLKPEGTKLRMVRTGRINSSNPLVGNDPAAAQSGSPPMGAIK
jgi:hypothetical protein